MDQFEEAACRRLGVGRSDLRALNLLEDGPQNAAALAAALGLSRGSVTALIDRLENAHLVARTSVPSDRRAVLVTLQPATWQAFAEVYRPVGEAVHEASTTMSHRDRQGAVRTMARLVEVFDGVRAQL